MNFVLLFLAVITAAVLAATLVDFVLGHRRLSFLKDVKPAVHGLSVSVVFAARNEATGLEAGLTSLLALDYPNLEIIAVNDRSTDATGSILDRIAAGDTRVKAVHLSELPNGWMGKNYALFAGASRASGEVLLFTDADIVFEPTTLRRAMRYFEERGLDHLTAIPDVRVPGLALHAFVTAFAVFFSMYSRPWKARDQRSRFHIGVGAFNLIRHTAYERLGTHRAIAMRPDDDLKLGKLVKKQGFRQDVVNGRDFIVVEWYRSLTEMIDGLMKNAFAGVNYSLWGAAGSTLALCLLMVWPFGALLVTDGYTRILNGVSALLVALIFWSSARSSGGRFWEVVAFPASAVLFSYVIWRSAFIAVARGTVTWRGTAYPLAQLRANRV